MTRPALALPTARPQRQGSLWFGLGSALLLITLVAVAFVQVRQYVLLNQAANAQDDYLVLSIQQIETEYLRLREQWQRAAEPARAAPKDDLQLRYDIFVSRIDLLQGERSVRLLKRVPSSMALLEQLRGFIAAADVHLGAGVQAPWTAANAQALLPALMSLGDPIRQVLLDANQQIAEQVTSRRERLRQHNVIGLAMTIFLSAMTLVFAFVALRQMRRMEQRRHALEQLADELRDARAVAESASAAKSEFLADMSHELRTPLHGLMGMLSLLKDAPGAAQGTDWLQTADESAQHLLRLLDDLLDLSKLEAGTLSLAPQTLNLGALLREVQALMRHQGEAKGLALEMQLDADLPTHVRLDPTRLRQVLFNLLTNAIKFSDRGSVRLQVRAGAGPDGQQTLDFEVCDSGIGMDSATIDQLFRRFARSDNPSARERSGTGLGLAISRNLARLMGGELVLASSAGGGSVFVFRCPLLRADSSSAPATAVAPAASPALRVLVAEDHPVNRKYLAALLERLGHQQRLVEDGEEALQAMTEQAFDVVLMDVHMPRMDGIAATAAIRALPLPAGRTLVIALTADVFDDTREQCLRAGADEVMTKPVNLAQLTALLVRHFGAAADSQPAAITAARSLATGEAPLLERPVCAQVLELMGGEKGRALYAGLLVQASEAGQRMREAMRQADLEALRRAAHAVKGAALNLGLAALAQAADLLSSDAKPLSAAQLALAVQRFEELVVATGQLCASEGLTDPPATAIR